MPGVSNRIQPDKLIVEDLRRKRTRELVCLLYPCQQLDGAHHTYSQLLCCHQLCSQIRLQWGHNASCQHLRRIFSPPLDQHLHILLLYYWRRTTLTRHRLGTLAPRMHQSDIACHWPLSHRQTAGGLTWRQEAGADRIRVQRRGTRFLATWGSSNRRLCSAARTTCALHRYGVIVWQRQ